ncbi:ribosomal protein S12 [Populus alba x Populus x berolinensis]|nr:ribosomal protein S12 [Populus alba x Populus x berolinensis]
MLTIKQLIRNTRQPIRNITKSFALGDALSAEDMY